MLYDFILAAVVSAVLFILFFEPKKAEKPQKEEPFDRGLSQEERRMMTILSNIENYDGTQKGQKEVI